jgi:hypothetical protein
LIPGIIIDGANEAVISTFKDETDQIILIIDKAGQEGIVTMCRQIEGQHPAAVKKQEPDPFDLSVDAFPGLLDEGIQFLADEDFFGIESLPGRQRFEPGLVSSALIAVFHEFHAFVEDISDGPVEILGNDGIRGLVSKKDVGSILKPPELAFIRSCSQKILEKSEPSEPVGVIVPELVFELDAHQAEIPEHIPDEFVLFLLDP